MSKRYTCTLRQAWYGPTYVPKDFIEGMCADGVRKFFGVPKGTTEIDFVFSKEPTRSAYEIYKVLDQWTIDMLVIDPNFRVYDYDYTLALSGHAVNLMWEVQVTVEKLLKKGYRYVHCEY